VLKLVTVPVTLLEVEANQASIPTIATWKLAVESEAIVTVTEDPEITQLDTRADGVVDGLVPDEVKTWQIAPVPKVWEPKV
jgi:hypothetical protein